MRLLDPFAALIIGPPLGLGVLWLISLGGWREVARRYPADDRRPSVRRRFCSLDFMSGRVPMNYGSCVTLGASRDGLFLRVQWPFRPFHPPIFVPWAAVHATSAKGWLGRFAVLRFADVPGVAVRLSERTAADLAGSVGRAGLSAVEPGT